MAYCISVNGWEICALKCFSSKTGALRVCLKVFIDYQPNSGFLNSAPVVFGGK